MSRPYSSDPVVTRVEALIERFPDEMWSISALSELAGVSPRTLFRKFRASRGTTPMKALLYARLARSRRLLESPRPGSTVTAVASSTGFSHLSRFAQVYKRVYGEAPSSTLRRAR